MVPEKIGDFLSHLKYADLLYPQIRAYAHMDSSTVDEYMNYRQTSKLDEYRDKRSYIIYYDAQSETGVELITGKSFPVINPVSFVRKERNEEIGLFFERREERVTFEKLKDYVIGPKFAEESITAMEKGMEFAKEQAKRYFIPEIEAFIDVFMEGMTQKKLTDETKP